MSQTILLSIPPVTFLATLLLTPIAYRILRRFGFWNAMDGEHKKRVVRGGGIAVAAAFFLAGYLWYYFTGFAAPTTLNGLIPALLIILITGIIDDRIGIRAFPKLLLQTASITLLWLCGYRIRVLFGVELPWFFSLGLTLFWVVSILNAFNLIDGLDGLCAGNALIAAGALWLMAYIANYNPLPIGPLLLIGCCAGFLIFNFHPAKLFLGDTGSLFLGLICAVQSLKISHGEFNFQNILFFLMVFWIPFCDMGLAVWRRKVKSMLKNSGCEITERDLYHLHYRLLNLTHNHALTVVIMWIGMAVIDVFALLVLQRRSLPFSLMIFGILCVFSLSVFAHYALSYRNCLIKHMIKRFFLKEYRETYGILRQKSNKTQSQQ